MIMPKIAEPVLIDLDIHDPEDRWDTDPEFRDTLIARAMSGDLTRLEKNTVQRHKYATDHAYRERIREQAKARARR